MDNDSRIKDLIYKRKNGEDIVNDPEAIASCKREQSRDVIDNARLGSYDKFGNYVIIPDIRRELLSLPKLIIGTRTRNGQTVYELKSNLPIFGDVFFKLSIKNDEAVLYITETVKREAGGYQEVYDEVLDSLATGTNGLPKSIIFRNYHITDDTDSFGKDDYNCSNILTRKVYLSLLSKELKDVSKLDEKQAFDNMVSTLKAGGVYGKKVLNEFVTRLKDRPAIFEISNTDSYNKAVNEVLLSALDISTTQEDKEDVSTRQTYLKVLNARNENIDEDIKLAGNRIDDGYVNAIVKKATNDRVENIEENRAEVSEEFFEQLASDKSNARPRRRTLDKPILKQGKESKNKQEGKEEKPQTKEEKIKSILEKKEKKKTPAGKKLKASKGKAGSKKLKAKKKGPAKAKKGAKKKKPGKAKLKGKNKKKKVKKPMGLKKAKPKGKTFGAKPGGPKKAGKKAPSKNATMKLALVTPGVAETPMFSSSSGSTMKGKEENVRVEKSHSHHDRDDSSKLILESFRLDRTNENKEPVKETPKEEAEDVLLFMGKNVAAEKLGPNAPTIQIATPVTPEENVTPMPNMVNDVNIPSNITQATPQNNPTLPQKTIINANLGDLRPEMLETSGIISPENSASQQTQSSPEE